MREDEGVTAYFRRLSASAFEPTVHVEGAWNAAEQHVGPVLGLLAHLVEADHAARRPDAPLVLARANYDILGVIPMEDFEVEMRVVRPGRTIELVEATLSHGGRPALTLRAWLLQTTDTVDVSGSPLSSPRGVDEFPVWEVGDIWAGGAIHSIEMRRESLEVGRATCWMRPKVPLLADEPVSARARMLGIVDFANGIAARESPSKLLFPNVDLTASVLREPVGEWFCLDTATSYGTDGIGLTESVVSDTTGPVGTSTQTLTIRRR